MARRTVQLRLGGQTYRVVTSASDEELLRLAAVVDQKLATVVPVGRTAPPQAMLLAAMALAHDLEAATQALEEERARSDQVTGRAREAFSRILSRVDAALVTTAGGTTPSSPASSSSSSGEAGGGGA